MAKLTPSEAKLFRERVIQEYKAKHEKPKKKPFHELFLKLRMVVPINIALGAVASIVLVWFAGWETLVYLFLSGVIWITIISTILGLLPKK